MKKALLFLSFLLTASGFAQKWSRTTEADLRSFPKMDRAAMPSKFQLFSLDLAQLKTQLQQAPLDSQGIFSNLIVAFPNPDGSLQQYRIYEAPVMEKPLADKYPDLKSYCGQSLSNPAASIRFSTTLFGLHLMSFDAGQGTFFIDTYTKDLKNYMVYKKQDVMAATAFQCGVDAEATEMTGHIPATQQRVSDGMFRTYRLAMACTIEYAAFHINAAGLGSGTMAQKKAAVLSAMTVTMTRVNGVFEKEMSLRMNLIAANDQLIFIDSDNFNNDDANVLIDQSQVEIDAKVNASSYDIGHTVSTGGGGLAQLFSPCTASKAKGITGSGAPVGDPYDIDYVAHEMGHQWGANHTQNNACNRNTGTAVEPGSASTIMGYAGICAPNVQSNSDAYFHAVSIAEMTTFLNGTGGSCAAATASGNVAPTVNAGADFTIPKGTAFILKGSGSDPNGDTLTYCWEQTNAQASTQPPIQTAVSGPNFRSKSPIPSPNRYMPPLADVVSGNLAPTWEVVPTVARTMNFALTARDNRLPSGAQTKRDDMVLTVANVGPFLVTSPNTAVSYQGNTSQTITWDVAGTTANGINCANVDIYLSANGGLTFPILLQSATPNDGTQSVTIPNLPGTQNRIMIIGSNHIFYDVSNANFTITGGTPETSAPIAPVLTASNTTQTSTLLSWSGASDNIAVTGYNIYRGGTLIGNVSESPYTAVGLVGGTTYTFTVRARDADGNLSPNSNPVSVTTPITDMTPPTAPVLTGSLFGNTNVQLSWTGATDNVGVAYYNIYNGSTLIGNVAASPTTLTGLSSATTYTFTVRAVDAAGNVSPASNVVTITTLIAYCASQGNQIVDESIGRVQFGTINNASSGGTGYTDFTSIATDITLGSSNTITITPFWTGAVYPESYAVYIDYNRNGDFADEGETVFTRVHTTSTPISGSIAIPNNPAFVGSTRMRVSMRYSDNAATPAPPPCGSFAYGQVEDYTVNIVGGNTTVVSAKFFIQGFYDLSVHAMRPVRSNQGVGTSNTNVDVVTLELRNAATLAVAATTTAMLQTNGTLTATYPAVITGPHYLVIKHRSTVQTWSAAAVTIGASTPLYDFANLASKAYGNNMILLETGVWGFYSGDLNQDESIDNTDTTDIVNDVDNSAFGDLATDLNGDGAVDNSDMPFLTNNVENSIYSVHP